MAEKNQDIESSLKNDHNLEVKPQSIKCDICLEKIESANSIVLKPCEHIFCKDCLSIYIHGIDHVMKIKCPSCDSLLDDDELKRALSIDVFTSLESRRAAQLDFGNNRRLVCPTPDCDGRLIPIGATENSSTVSQATCHQCKISYCLTCRSRLTSDELLTVNHVCKESHVDEIQELIEQGLLMRCPRCSALLEKIDSGCQFVRCFVCKLDICYITRQPRWGPNGKGDTSAGCRCGVDGKKCHPDCTNCH